MNKLRDYEFKEIEKKWQERWSKDNIFKTENEVEGKEKITMYFQCCLIHLENCMLDMLETIQ